MAAIEYETFVVIVYGPSGTGKTTDQGYSFPTALFGAAPGALSSIRSVCGYVPKSVEIATIQDATKLLKEAAGKVKVLVIDDFSFMAEQTFALLEKKYKNYDLWGKLRDVALEFRDQARYSKISVVMNAWEKAPQMKDGIRVRGCPALSGRLPEQIPALCDVVLRASFDAKRKPWPAVYRCYLDPSWTMKDRFDIAPRIDPSPMNLAELLRAGGVSVERHTDLPKQEDWVEGLSRHFMEAADTLVAAN